MKNKQGQFVISLDFEMYWGVRDIYSMRYYEEQMAGERALIPRLLELFEQHHIHATWAIVGLLFFENLEEMKENLPRLTPTYSVQDLSPYPYIQKGNVGPDESLDPHHYALSLINVIRATKHQQISTHTFSHYYCLEEGQSFEHFIADLKAAIQTAENKGLKIESIIFPRNQVNESYVPVLSQYGIRSYRGNPSHWIYRKGYSRNDSMLKRLMRLLDAYMNVTGHNCYSIEELPHSTPVNLPASHFLRPYSKRSRILEGWRIKRILSSMTYAAKHGLVYHLWWHPYNFAIDEEKNLASFQIIIDHFKKLQLQYGMVSTSMEELCNRILGMSSVQKQSFNRLSQVYVREVK
ncbi:polysaccharide deacetylase family protein [Paenibacillus aestuarii]|uniref:Polysaccharide deacetylase family protein n=1 Tax=Paenibacillus aestuarii TaxID=516965 RepID=A0ABW0K0U2_9BACL|nr:polysaccharide deacetylase family protein [Paenibacillus aestuarii]